MSHRLQAFQQVAKNYFASFQGDLVDSADLPEEARGLRWKVVDRRDGRRVMVNSWGDVGVEIADPVTAELKLARLDSDASEIAVASGYGDLDELNDVLATALQQAIIQSRHQVFLSELKPEERTGFEALMGPKDDVPDEIDDDTIQAGLKWVMHVTSRPYALDEHEVESVFEVVERFEMRGITVPGEVFQSIAAMAAGDSVSANTGKRIIGWLDARDPVEAKLAEATRNHIDEVYRGPEEADQASASSRGKRMLGRLLRMFDASEQQDEETQPKGPRI